MIKEHIMNRIVVCDIDGTIADIQHRRHWVASKPKNWAAFNAGMSQDTVHEDIAELLTVFADRGCRIILCSGRGEENRAVTEAWLADNDIPYNSLYMRPEGDRRQDSIVKVELLEQICADYGTPWLWLDDRNQVVDAIRAQGIRVLQVAPGYF